MRAPSVGLCLVLSLAAGLVACGGSNGGGGSGPTKVLVVTPDSVDLADCSATQLLVQLQDENGAPVPGATYSFNTTDGAVASVSQTGVITGQGPGSAHIVVTSSGLIQNVPVTVTAVPPTLTGVPDSVLLWPTVADTLDIVEANCHGSVLATASLTSADPATASVSGQSVTGVAYGRTMLTTTADTFVRTFAARVIGHPGSRSVVSTPLGGGPYGVAVTATGRILVAQIGGNTLAFGQLPSTAFNGGIPVGFTPPHVAVNPAGTRAFVTLQGGNAVAVVDLTTNQVVGDVPLAGNGFNVLVSRDGSRVFATTDVGWAYMLDEATTAKLDSFTVGLVANGLAEHPTQPLIYFSSRDAGTVTVYDYQTATAVDTFVTGGRPQRMAVSPDGNTLYVADETLGVDIWNTATAQRVTTVPVPAYGLGLSPDGLLLVVASAGPTVQFVDAVTHQVLPFLTVGGTTRNVAFEPSGRTVIVTDEQGAVDFIR